MKIIDRHNYISVVCVCFTLVVCGKLILEKLTGFTDEFYIENIFICLGICVLATFILSMHYYLQNLPFIPVVIGQYVLLIGVIFASIWISSRFIDMSPSAYKDMFVSVTIPYVIGAAAYYISYFWQIKKANDILITINYNNIQDK
jgi:xanthine/uracil permease